MYVYMMYVYMMYAILVYLDYNGRKRGFQRLNDKRNLLVRRNACIYVYVYMYTST